MSHASSYHTSIIIPSFNPITSKNVKICWAISNLINDHRQGCGFPMSDWPDLGFFTCGQVDFYVAPARGQVTYNVRQKTKYLLHVSIP